MTPFNERVIAEFRANRGQVGAWGTNLVLIHHTSVPERERVNPAMSLRDGDEREVAFTRFVGLLIRQGQRGCSVGRVQSIRWSGVARG
jgi:hypothetical protein